MDEVALLSSCTYQGEFAGNALESRFDGGICFNRLLDSAMRNVEVSRLFPALNTGESASTMVLQGVSRLFTLLVVRVTSDAPRDVG